MALQLSTTLRNTILDAFTTAIGASALIRIYSGTPPASVAAALGGNTLLAELVANATFAPSASNGVLTLNSIANDAAADATGTATFFRIYRSDGSTCVLQGTVGTSEADLTVATTSFVANAVISIATFTITAPGA